MTDTKDWLAYIPICAGGSWARGKDRGDTIRRALRIAKSDWNSLVDFGGLEVGVLVADVTGFDQVYMDGGSVWTVPEGADHNQPAERQYLPKDRLELVRHIYPGSPKKRKAS